MNRRNFLTALPLLAIIPAFGKKPKVETIEIRNVVSVSGEDIMLYVDKKPLGKIKTVAFTRGVDDVTSKDSNGWKES